MRSAAVLAHLAVDDPSHPAGMRSASCVTCHVEHRGRDVLLSTSDATCTRCHDHLKLHSTDPDHVRQVNNRVTAYTVDHPPFGQDLMVDGRPRAPTPLEFNHDAHFVQYKVDADNCAACHSTDAPQLHGSRPSPDVPPPWTGEKDVAFFKPATTGPAATRPSVRLPLSLAGSAGRRPMQAVSYDRSCLGCHAQGLKPDDSPGEVRAADHVVAIDGGPPDAKAIVLPHKPLGELRGVIAGYLGLSLAGGKFPDDAKAIDWARSTASDLNDRLSKVATPGLRPVAKSPAAAHLTPDNLVDLYTARLAVRQCAQCHQVQGTLPALAGDGDDMTYTPGSYQLVPTGVGPAPRRWYPTSTFDHGAHQDMTCVSCHAKLGGVADFAKVDDADARDSLVRAASDDTEVLSPGMAWNVYRSAKVPPAKDAAKDAAERTANHTCVACHTASDHASMHKQEVANLSCVDCHGGHTDVIVPPSVAALPHDAPAYRAAQRQAHVRPRLPDLWGTSAASPVLPGALTARESTDYVRFVNPGDLRAAPAARASCHNSAEEGYAVNHVRTSMMAHGAMLWEAALYNNGAIGRKNAVYADDYDRDGRPARVATRPSPTADDLRRHGWLANLWPLPRWEVTEPGNILRAFERGGQRRPVVGVPDREENPGRPDDKLSVRGLGTDVRTDPVFLGLQKTRLLDPTLNLFGTTDHAGDCRGSGCTACHVVYANDRSPVHSASFAGYGNAGESFSVDPTVDPPAGGRAATQPVADPFDATRRPRQAGHPIKHQFEKSPPASSCIVCQVHPGTNGVNAYYGYTWWDNETDGQATYPKRQRYPTEADAFRVSQSNPEGSAVRGLWSDPAFLAKVATTPS